MEQYGYCEVYQEDKNLHSFEYEWLYSKKSDTPLKNIDGPEIGDMRIRWEIVRCCEVTVIAQQIQTEENYTLRPWNPLKEKDSNNDPDVAISCPITCICCYIVESLFKHLSLEVIDEIIDSRKSSEEILDELDAKNQGQTTLFRWLSWVGSTLGHYLLFSPIIKLLAWIPLVGSLLSTALAVAAFLFAIIWATTLHFLILGVAWVVYRPLVGILMLTGVACLIGVMFLA